MIRHQQPRHPPHTKHDKNPGKRHHKKMASTKLGTLLSSQTTGPTRNDPNPTRPFTSPRSNFSNLPEHPLRCKFPIRNSFRWRFPAHRFRRRDSVSVSGWFEGVRRLLSPAFPRRSRRLRRLYRHQVRRANRPHPGRVATVPQARGNEVSLTPPSRERGRGPGRANGRQGHGGSLPIAPPPRGYS